MDNFPCRHCGEPIENDKCNTCGVELEKECRCQDCHNEVVHGEISNHNIHIAGNLKKSKLDSVDNDPDAYNPSFDH